MSDIKPRHGRLWKIWADLGHPSAKTALAEVQPKTGVSAVLRLDHVCPVIRSAYIVVTQTYPHKQS